MCSAQQLKAVVKAKEVSNRELLVCTRWSDHLCYVRVGCLCGVMQVGASQWRTWSSRGRWSTRWTPSCTSSSSIKAMSLTTTTRSTPTSTRCAAEWNELVSPLSAKVLIHLLMQLVFCFTSHPRSFVSSQVLAWRKTEADLICFETNEGFLLCMQVLQRRTGIPISLSVLYLTLARRLGVQLEPVNFPNHFLLRWCQKAMGCGWMFWFFWISLDT